MELQTGEILNLAIDRASAVNTYWNLYIAVATAVIGTMASGKVFTGSLALKVFLSLAFVVFAASNLWAILRLGDLRTALIGMLPETLPASLTDSIRPASATGYSSFHIALDLVVLACIWFVPWPRNPA